MDRYIEKNHWGKVIMSTDDVKPKFDQFRSQLSPFGWKFINDWSVTLAALIAYYFLIALIPLIICVFSATILIFGNDSRILNKVRDRIETSFSDENVVEITDALANSISEQAITVLVISFIVAIFTSSRLFTGIDDVLTIIYRIRERTILNQNIHAIKLLLVFITIAIIIIICLSVPAFVTKNPTFYKFLTISLSGLFVFILFSFFYYFVPQRKMSWSRM